MPDNKLSEIQFENLMEAITNAVLADQKEFDSILRRYDVTHEEIQDYVALIEAIHANLQPHPPHAAFIEQLRADLLGTSAHSGLQRFPMRARLATILAAILAATVWVARRRNSDEAVAESLEEAAAHQAH